MKKFAMMAALMGTTLLASGAIAQTAPANPAASGSTQAITQLSPGTMRLSEFLDLDVIGPDNKDIGDVEDIVFGPDGTVAAVVVEIDKGIGDRTVALPMSAFQLVPEATTTGSVQAGTTASTTRNPDDMKLKLGMSVEQLKALPEFDDND